jgi:catechol 2,3-dioxygenase-like lactoylglutathione lyase family enzyme
MPDSLPLLGLNHIAVTTSDPERSAAFYRDVLGFEPMERPPFSFRGAWLRRHGLQIHVIEHGEHATEEAIDTRADHFAFAVSDFDEVERILAAHGIRYHKQVNAGGIPQIFFRDPDGHTIEIGIYAAGRY